MHEKWSGRISLAAVQVSCLRAELERFPSSLLWAAADGIREPPWGRTESDDRAPPSTPGYGSIVHNKLSLSLSFSLSRSLSLSRARARSLSRSLALSLSRSLALSLSRSLALSSLSRSLSFSFSLSLSLSHSLSFTLSRGQARVALIVMARACEDLSIQPAGSPAPSACKYFLSCSSRSLPRHTHTHTHSHRQQRLAKYLSHKEQDKHPNAQP
jgi:hypothetical protein